MKTNNTLAIGILVASLCTMLLTYAITPKILLTSQKGELRINEQVPEAFGQWRVLKEEVAYYADSGQQALLQVLYSELLERTYVNKAGDRVMLTIAYGTDQRDGFNLHQPEVCYPAQGFQVVYQRKEDFDLLGRKVLGKRMVAQFQDRVEPISYWTMIGEQSFRGGLDKKLTEMRYGIQGLIVDGLLIRISSIDANKEKAFMLHDAFMQDFLTALPESVLSRYIGVQ
jgi:EpsI family protein